MIPNNMTMNTATPPPPTATFTCKTSELRATLKRMQPALPTVRAYARRIVCEITVLDGRIRIVIPGIDYYVACRTTKNSCKFSLHFVYFQQILKDYKGTYFNAFIEPGLLRWGSANAKEVKTTFFEDDTILRSISLPMNPSPLDLATLKEKHTSEELRFNELAGAAAFYERRVELDIENAMKFLRVYGITSEELRGMIERRREG